jgi:hypothetical protein
LLQGLRLDFRSINALAVNAGRGLQHAHVQEGGRLAALGKSLAQ